MEEFRDIQSLQREQVAASRYIFHYSYYAIMQVLGYMENVDQKIAHNKVQCRKTDLWDNCKLIACYKYTKNDVMYDDIRSTTLRPPLARGVVKVWHGGRQARILRMARRKQYVILISSDLSGGETQSWKGTNLREVSTFTITKEAPTRAFSWLKVATTPFTYI